MPGYHGLNQPDRSWILDQMSLYPSNWNGPVSERLRGMNYSEDEISIILSELPGIVVIPETNEYDEIRWPSLDMPLWQMDDLNWDWVNPEIGEEDRRSKFYCYREDFLRNQNFTDDSIKQLRIDTLRILDRCGNPHDWDGNKRGLVFGSIQSGKTASMEGLVCAALDAGYNHIFILTSNVENLRFQTQLRFRDSVLTFSNNDNPYKLTTEDSDLVDVSRDTPLRRRERDRHVRAMKHQGSKFSFGIFKKHASVLQGLVSVMQGYFEGRNGEQDSVLIIDDECDYASINTRHRRIREADSEKTRIHRLICELLEAIPRNTYVGYTATPQASILQSTQSEIFPRDFLWVLEPAETYCGPHHFFETYSEYLLEEVPSEEWVIDPPPGERAADVQLDDLRRRVREENPQNSLKSAMVDYILSGAIRWWRCRDHETESRKKPNHALMIHFSHLTAIHAEAEELSKITLEMVISAFNNIFGRDFQIDSNSKIEKLIVKRLARFNEKIEAIRNNPGRMMTLELLQPFIEMIIQETGHRKLDSSGRHSVILDYDTESEEDKVPRSMIVIGGNVLSRGLTIQGLTVSYFLRSPRTKVQDSMLQQNRWYGHKLNYLDLCTVYIQQHIMEVLEQMTIADTELRSDLVDMIQYEMTPAESLLSLMSHPIFRPTNRAKLRLADAITADTFSGRNWQFQEPILKGAHADDNFWHFTNFIDHKLGIGNATPVGSDQGLLWENVSLEVIQSFLQDELQTKEHPWRIVPSELIEYLIEWKAEGNLPQINVGFKFGKDGERISNRGRKMHNPTLEKQNPDSYTGQFKNLTRGRGNNYLGDWYFDDYLGHNTENWFKTKRKRDGGTILTTSRAEGAPILFLFYQLNPLYVNRSPRFSVPSDHDAAGEHPLPVFIVSLPPNGPERESRWYNSEQLRNPDIRYSGETGPVDENPMLR